MQPAGRNGIIATLDPGRNLRRREPRPLGSVIVGDTNQRFFEPAPRRNAIAGINAVSRF